VRDQINLADFAELRDTIVVGDKCVHPIWGDGYATWAADAIVIRECNRLGDQVDSANIATTSIGHKSKGPVGGDADILRGKQSWDVPSDRHTVSTGFGRFASADVSGNVPTCEVQQCHGSRRRGGWALAQDRRKMLRDETWFECGGKSLTKSIAVSGGTTLRASSRRHWCATLHEGGRWVWQ
jgi:hypothetical protein